MISKNTYDTSIRYAHDGFRDTGEEYITFDCPKKDYNEIKTVLKYYRYAFYDEDIKKKEKDAIIYEVKLYV